MDKKWKFVLYPLAVLGCFLLVIFGYFIYSIEFRTHAAPEFYIGNNFDQTVEVYVQGKKLAKISPGDSKIIYPNDDVVLIVNPDTDVLLEIKSKSGTILYSRTFTFDEAGDALCNREPFWVGD